MSTTPNLPLGVVPTARASIPTVPDDLEGARQYAYRLQARWLNLQFAVLHADQKLAVALRSLAELQPCKEVAAAVAEVQAARDLL